MSIEAKGVDRVPFVWFWPDGASSCVTMTHDVETETGRDYCSELMNVDDAFGVKAAFGIVPEERYEVSPSLLDAIRNRGFEVAVQDLNHDGRLLTAGKSSCAGRTHQSSWARISRQGIPGGGALSQARMVRRA